MLKKTGKLLTQLASAIGPFSCNSLALKADISALIFRPAGDL